MEQLKLTQAKRDVFFYLQQDNFRPYFVSVSCVSDVAELSRNFSGLEQVHISDFCIEDFPLDVDLLIDKLTTLKKDAICFGLGEYIFLTAQDDILLRLYERSFNRKIIFVCRGISNFLERLAGNDFKFRRNNFVRVVGKENLSVVKYNPALEIETDAKNFFECMCLLESGKSALTVKTILPLVNVKEINSHFDALKLREPQFLIPPTALANWQWREIFFDDECTGYSPEHWRTFAAMFRKHPTISYLKFIFERSSNYDEYRRNLFFGLLEVADEKFFEEFYWQRKIIVKSISSEFLSEYFERLKNFSSGSDVIKYLTDNTDEEKKEMIRATRGSEEIPSALEENFPSIRDYLTDFDFGEEEITTYFRIYKRTKLSNVAGKKINRFVQKFSFERPYNKFPSRQEVLEKFDSRAKLYWLDALGVEFLSYIKVRAQQIGLVLKIKIARAELPTLTALNKNFYEEWSGSKFDKNSNLDDLKHSLEKFDGEGKCSAPTYIVDELKIIDAVLNEINIFLMQHPNEKVILTSDHGASRLAVMFKNGKRYKMKSAGEHGGRCCQMNDSDMKVPLCVTAENGYWVLANYDRFAGGRINSVEVHGGATLEEVLIPVIEFAFL